MQIREFIYKDNRYRMSRRDDNSPTQFYMRDKDPFFNEEFWRPVGSSQRIPTHILVEILWQTLPTP